MSARHGEPARPCPFCGQTLAVVHVHGHGQCANCGTNVEPCCGGAANGDAQVDGGAPELEADPQLFVRVFAQLGGAGATVSGDALRFALAQWLGIDLDAAAVVIDAGVHTDKLVAASVQAFRLPTTD